MSAKSRHTDALAEMRVLNPVSTAALRDSIGGADLERAMQRSIALADASPAAPATTPRRRTLRYGVAAGLACAVAVVALVLSAGGSPGGSGGPAYAAAAIEVAEANPRLLVTSPGWKVTDAGEFEAGAGEVSFGDGSHSFAVHWYPARMYGSYLRDRAQVSRPEASELFGRRATTVHYAIRGGEDEYATMLAPAPNAVVFVETRGRFADRAEYDAVLHSLRRVDVDSWLAAMPRRVVAPDARAAAVAAMLRGVPLPPGFDRDALAGEETLLNHYQLAVEVAGKVSCGWVETWLAATKAGDERRAGEAVRAMASSLHWPMMPLLVKGGGWSGNVLHAARAIASGHVDRGSAGELVRPDGTGYALGPSWAVGLNCTDRYWRRPISR